MRKILRFGGIGFILIGAVLALVYAFAGPKAPVGDLSEQMQIKDKVISGAYKTYGAKDCAVPMWLAKTVFRNNMNARITNLKVRYKVSEYSDWCSWHQYAAVDPTQTVVDLYHPIFTSAIAKLTSRAPAELQMECEYTDATGKKGQLSETRSLTVLGRQEFIFSDLTSEERTTSFQDKDTYSPLMAAWVSRSDDVVARLASMANKQAGGLGASQNDESCIKVMAALYDIMRTIHISYQHPAVAEDPNMSYDIKVVQSLQYPRDTIEKRSGTCIDLAILYAAMLNSVNIEPYLISKDGHCFPAGRTPSGQLIPVETTGVADGYGKARSFEDVVKYGFKEWKEVNETGRFDLVDIRKCWMSGVANPELEPLPPDILEKWGIVALVEGGGQPQTVLARNGEEARHPQVARVRPQPEPVSPRPSAQSVAGKWAYKLTALDGRIMNGHIQITLSGGQLQMVATASYSAVGADGYSHQFSERNNFVGALDGQSLSAQCSHATYTMDGRQVPPQGLPLRLNLSVSGDGTAMQGQVSNSMGMTVPIVLQKLR
jgi:hypothetical protein